MFLTKIEPYIVLLLQIAFYGHRTTLLHVLLLAFHLFGALLLSTGGTITLSPDLLGDGLIFFGVLIHALLYAPAQHYSVKLGSLVASGSGQVLGGLFLLPFALIYAAQDFTLSPQHLTGWYYTLITVVVFYILSTALWFHSLKSVPAWLASALRCAGPVIAAPFAWYLYNQTLTRIQILGALTVIATSVIMVLLERRSTSAN
jgi:probable blue pigment (indigoidine) exporter